MSIRWTARIAAIAAALTGLAILLFDAPLARALEGRVGHDTFRPAVHALEIATGMTLHKFLVGGVLIIVGAAVWRWRSALGRRLVLVGATALVTRLVAGSLKPPLGRLRPREALEQGIDLGVTFFRDGGIAFPSGHVAHFSALAFAVAIAWPRAALPAFAVAAFVLVARVAVNDHWLGDALGSVALAAGFAAAFAWLLRIR